MIMKKTLTINLNSTVFNIDEDAYEKLQGYLNELRLHLEKDERDEVMQDIEARVGELFGEEIGRYKSVISIEDVDKVIETLGTPDSFGPITEEKQTASRSRKFYRSADNHVLGGVAAGVAALIGWDATLVRLIFFVLLCASFGWMTLLYILLWIIVPEARTVAQKLEMQGIEPSLQNISDYSHNNVQAEPAKENNIMKTMFKVIGVLVLFPLIIVLLAVVIGLFVACAGALLAWTPDLLGLAGVQWSLGHVIPLILFALASVVIPLVFIIKLIVRAVRHSHKETNRTAFVIWLIVWIASVIATMVLLVRVVGYGNAGRWKEVFVEEFMDDYDDVSADLVTEVRCEGEAFRNIDVRKIDVCMVRDTVDMVEITAPSSKMRNVTADVKDSTLIIDVNKNTFKVKHIKAIVHHTGDIGEIQVSAGADLKGRMAAANDVSFTVSAGSEISLDELTSTERVNIKASSGSEVEIDRIEVPFVDLRISSGSEAELKGRIRRMNVDASSGSAVDIKDLMVDSLQMSMSSGASMKKPRTNYIIIK